MMKCSIIISLLFFLTCTITQAGSKGLVFDKADFYAAMSSDNVQEINSQLAILKGAAITEKDAYEGALLMKKAGLVSNTKEKLTLFKSGRSKLESSILKETDNIEYRFLRIIIQEHAPRIVKYKSQLEEDSKLIRSNFKNLSSFLQQVINDYSKKSAVLKIA